MGLKSMEKSFIDFLNSLGAHPFGTWLAIILGGVTVIGGIIAAIVKMKKKYDDELKTRLMKEEEDKEFRESMQKVANQVSSIQTDIINLSSQHESSIAEVNSKLEDVGML
jgi:heme exporter protein D